MIDTIIVGQRLGMEALAGVATGLKINNFLQAPLDAVAQTMAPFAGQNLGAGKIERIRKGVKASVYIGFVLAIFMFIVAALLGQIARGIVGLVLIPKFGFTGVQFAHPIAWVCGDILLIPALFFCIRQASIRYKHN